MRKKYWWFTFVELVVVIVILAILSTIGFTEYESYLSSGRDTKRIAELRGLQQSLANYSLNTKLPLPNDAVKILASGNLISYHGDISDTIVKNIGFKWQVFDTELSIFPIYVLSKNRKDFQLMSFLEDKSSLFAAAPSAHAFTDYQNLTPKTIGKPLWVFLDSDTSIPLHRIVAGGNTDYDIVSWTWSFQIYFSDRNIFSTQSEDIMRILPDQSCKRLLEMWKSQGSGIYTISPTWSGKLRVYCDMRTDGGGWTLLVNNDNSDDESVSSTDCKPRLSWYAGHSCWNIQTSEDFSIHADGISFQELAFVWYKGMFSNILTYQYMKWDHLQVIPPDETFESDLADSWDNTLSGLESKNNLRCQTWYDPHYITLHYGDGVFEPHTAFQFALSGTEREFSFIDDGNSAVWNTYGLDDYQDSDGWCSDHWNPKQYRGYSAYIMVR